MNSDFFVQCGVQDQLVHESILPDISHYIGKKAYFIQLKCLGIRHDTYRQTVTQERKKRKKQRKNNLQCPFQPLLYSVSQQTLHLGYKLPVDK